MWPHKRLDRSRAFAHYWDALAGGVPAEELARLRERVDPTLIAATERVRSDHRPRQADSAFVARLEDDLMGAIAPNPTSVPVVAARPRSSNGLTAPGVRRGWR